MRNQYEAYQQNAVLTASPGELTLMLYKGCIKFIRIAEKAIQDHNLELKHQNLTKAQNIINELIVTLNMDYAVSKDMRKLYDYINRRLIEANIKNDVTILHEVIDLVTQFQDTWKEALVIYRKKKYSTSGLI